MGYPRQCAGSGSAGYGDRWNELGPRLKHTRVQTRFEAIETPGERGPRTIWACLSSGEGSPQVHAIRLAIIIAKSRAVGEEDAVRSGAAIQSVVLPIGTINLWLNKRSFRACTQTVQSISRPSAHWQPQYTANTVSPASETGGASHTYDHSGGMLPVSQGSSIVHPRVISSDMAEMPLQIRSSVGGFFFKECVLRQTARCAAEHDGESRIRRDKSPPTANNRNTHHYSWRCPHTFDKYMSTDVN